MTEGLSDEEESVLVSLARDDGWGNGWGNEDRNMPSSDGLVGTSSDYATERAPPGDTTTMCAAPNPGGGNDTLTDVAQTRAGPPPLPPATARRLKRAGDDCTNLPAAPGPTLRVRVLVTEQDAFRAANHTGTAATKLLAVAVRQCTQCTWAAT